MSPRKVYVTSQHARRSGFEPHRPPFTSALHDPKELSEYGRGRQCSSRFRYDNISPPMGPVW